MMAHAAFQVRAAPTALARSTASQPRPTPSRRVLLSKGQSTRVVSVEALGLLQPPRVHQRKSRTLHLSPAHAAGAGAEWYEDTPGETEEAGERLAAEALRKHGADLPVTSAKEPTIQDYLHFTLDKGLGSALLLGATVLSLYLANHAALSAGYLAFWDHHLAVPFIPGLNLSIRHWVNEGLMAFFFFVVGLDIKREFVHGSLKDIRQAMLPCLGALGGMVWPMAVCIALNYFQPGGNPAAWAVPMATDIAFAMGVYNCFKNRMPAGVAAFLLTLATVDDLGAIAVIAVFFAGHISLPYLGASVLCCAALVAMQKRPLKGKGVSAGRLSIFAAIGTALWYCLLQGGINADVAGVLTAFAIPIDAAAPAHSKAEAEHPGVPPSLVDHLIHLWVPLTSLLIMPVFALANTAVSLGGAAGSVLSLLQMPVAQGIGLGLVLGKPVGITLTALAGIKLGLAKWPTGMHEGHLWTVGVLGGIGFTMSLFLIECSLTGTSAAAGKLAILAASVTAAAVGAVLMNMMDPVAQEGDSKGNPLIKPVVEPSPTVVPLPSPQ